MCADNYHKIFEKGVSSFHVSLSLLYLFSNYFHFLYFPCHLVSSVPPEPKRHGHVTEINLFNLSFFQKFSFYMECWDDVGNYIGFIFGFIMNIYYIIYINKLTFDLLTFMRKISISYCKRLSYNTFEIICRIF